MTVVGVILVGFLIRGISLLYILSMTVAVVCVILVGLLIRGKNAY